MKSQHSYFLVKQEPSTYPWEQFCKEGGTAWTGVRNFQARNNLRSMQEGDLVLYYHSVVGKAVVGIAKVVREAYADPTASDGDWDCVDLAPVRTLSRPVSLEEVKNNPALSEIALLRQSRLSVMPLSEGEFQEILRCSELPAPK